MEKNKEPPTIPSNYVTLSQLQQRWLKEKKNKQQPNLNDGTNDETERNYEAPGVPQNHRNGNRKYQGVNRHFNEGCSGASPEGNETETTVDETKSKDLGVFRKYQGVNRRFKQGFSGSSSEVAFVEGNERDDTKSKYLLGNRKYQGVNRNFKQGFSGASSDVAFVGAVAVIEGNESESSVDQTKSKDFGGNPMYQGVNRHFEQGFSDASPEVAFTDAVAVIEGNESENTVDQMKSTDLGGNMRNKKSTWEEKKKKSKDKKRKMKEKKNQQKEKMMEDGGTGTQGEGEVILRETHVPPAKSEKKGSWVRAFARRRDISSDFRAKSTSVVDTSDSAVEIEGKVKHVTEKSEDTVDMERKLGDLCIEVESERSMTRENTFNGSSSEYRVYDRSVDNRCSKYSGYNRTNNYRGHNGVFNRQSTEYRSHYGGGYQRYGQYRGSNDWWRERDGGNGMVWVKKGEVAGGTDNE